MLSVLKWGNINKIYSLIKSIKEDIIRYKILIKKPQLSKDTFTFYSETTSTVNDETGEVSKTTAIYETNNLSDLADKYEALLATYTTTEMKVVEDLDIDMIVNINDN